jgi:PLP dependent protein
VNPIASNIERLRARIATLACDARRNPGDIKLIAVSKTHPVEALEAAIEAGQFAFGENTIQEALPKIAYFAQRDFSQSAAASEVVPARRAAPASEIVPEWHFIGHLQSNKAKFVPGNFSWIHSLDSHKLAQRLSRLAQDVHVVVNALIEVNITQDPRKHGVAPQAVPPLLDDLLRDALPGIALRGLMAIGPYPADEATVRRAYARLRELRDHCAKHFNLKAFDQLSIGMSGDYAEAIHEGATLLRIGTAIFGERKYGKTPD